MTRQSAIPPLLRDIVCLATGAVGYGYALWSRAGWEPLLISAALMAEPALLRGLAGIADRGSSWGSASSEPPSPSARRSQAPSDDDDGCVRGGTRDSSAP